MQLQNEGRYRIMKLIIAEKPELARAISKAVSGDEKKCEGYIRKGEYLIT